MIRKTKFSLILITVDTEGHIIYRLKNKLYHLVLMQFTGIRRNTQYFLSSKVTVSLL